MKMVYCFLLMFLPILAAGCSQPADRTKKEPASPAAKSDAESVAENLAKLSPADRKLVEDQQYCAVMTKNLLGSMGIPYKIDVNGQPVFLCCDGCETRAKAHADRTLAKVQELKEAKAKKSESK